MKIKQILLVSVGVLAVSAIAFAAVLTPSFGILSAPVFVRASFADRTDVKFKVKGHHQEVINVKDAQETVMQQIVIAPGGNTGWHTHPGPAVVLIKSGQMSFYDSDDPTCMARTYSAGQALLTAVKVTCI
jgi:quercetin dioxygenase-like cupin family protein